MTPKKKLFADKYLANGFNATQAAQFAGYKSKNYKSLNDMGYRLKKDPEVKAYIRERLELIDKTLMAQSGELLKFWTRVLRDQETEEKVLYKVIIDSEGEAQEFIKRVNVRTALRNRLKSSEYLATYHRMLDGKPVEKSSKVTIVRGSKK
jgi:phage terminase small subunit